MNRKCCALLYALRAGLKEFARCCEPSRKPKTPTVGKVQLVPRYLVPVNLEPTDPKDAVQVRHLHVKIDGTEMEPLSLPGNAVSAVFYVPVEAAGAPKPEADVFIHDIDYAGNESEESDHVTFTVADTTPPGKPGTLSVGKINVVPDEPPAPTPPSL